MVAGSCTALEYAGQGGSGDGDGTRSAAVVVAPGDGDGVMLSVEADGVEDGGGDACKDGWVLVGVGGAAAGGAKAARPGPMADPNCRELEGGELAMVPL